MLTYQVRPRIFRHPPGEQLTFPALCELCFHFQPPQPEFPAWYQNLEAELSCGRTLASDVTGLRRSGSDCGAEKSITDALKKTDLGQWQTLSVNMNCFKKAKMDMLLSPFTLHTKGELGLTLHHVRIESTPTATISCQ